jgi:hypothetical protein
VTSRRVLEITLLVLHCSGKEVSRARLPRVRSGGEPTLTDMKCPQYSDRTVAATVALEVWRSGAPVPARSATPGPFPKMLPGKWAIVLGISLQSRAPPATTNRKSARVAWRGKGGEHFRNLRRPLQNASPSASARTTSFQPVGPGRDNRTAYKSL